MCCRTCSSVSFEYRSTAHRLWMGSIIFSEMLHARAKRVVLEKISIVRRSACRWVGVGVDVAVAVAVAVGVGWGWGWG